MDAFIKSLPMYEIQGVPYNWGIEHTFSPVVACLLFAADLWVWYVSACTERDATAHAHKKYTAQSTTRVVFVHFLTGVVETVLGLLYILTGEAKFATASAYVALLMHAPTGLFLSPKVWGLKHITVTGYLLVGICRIMQALRVIQQPHKLPDLWILLHMATAVRLCSYYITPFSSSDGGRRGDLVTDPLVYTLSVSLAALVTLSFVYPPVFSLAALGVVALVHKVCPSSVASRFPALAHQNKLRSRSGSRRKAKRS
jgi:hypothetical protein